MKKHHLLTYALNADGNLVFIEDVKNGLECGCICPGCKEPLIAKNDGKIREHHFAHISGAECVSGYQSMIHLLAKDIIKETKLLPFAQNGHLINALDVQLEVNLAELNIIPDVLAVVRLVIDNKIAVNVPFIVEIYVTHKVDNEKAEVIRKAGIPAVEIDLSKIDFISKEQLCQEIYNPKNWCIINASIGSRFLPKIQISVPAILNAYRAACPQSSYEPRQHRNYYHRRPRRR